ncbi:hypothetical protein [Candidatus Contubernalis alkaliaceticus]|uniref:hypothetical protein n=1 Tax=Candidatus Contubernalis alkaliaceticus TaxID=338645 RepID=UPI001F4C36E9|nr:hypothetical protein [Candidatus Contubernalis alkalaceticus]UNC91674.1 hypothetical protein HUE98_05950 [Candidatus Contubernalis alkalaceticus]
MDTEPLVNPSGDTKEDSDLGCTVVRTTMSYEDAEKLLAEKRMKGKIAVEKVMEYSREELKDLLVREGLKSSEVAKRLNAKPSCVHILRKLFDLQEKDIQEERIRLNYQAPKTEENESHDDRDGLEKIKETPKIKESSKPDIEKFITSSGKVAAAELLGTAKSLERLENAKVTVEVKVWTSAEQS